MPSKLPEEELDIKRYSQPVGVELVRSFTVLPQPLLFHVRILLLTAALSLRVVSLREHWIFKTLQG